MRSTPSRYRMLLERAVTVVVVLAVAGFIAVWVRRSVPVLLSDDKFILSDGTDFFESEMASSGCEPDTAAALYANEGWANIGDVLVFTDVVAVVKAGKVADRTNGNQIGPAGADL